MKISKTSLSKSPRESPIPVASGNIAPCSRATISLSRETYLQIDLLRGDEARAAWLKNLVEKEAKNRAREKFTALLQDQYTEEVCLETLRLNEEFPIHES